MPYLAFNLNDGNEFVFDILEERLSIGRDVKNHIVIDNTYISGFHAEFVRQADGVYELVDLKSSNGTYVNGKRIDRMRVKGGDKIRFGQLDSRFRERAPKGTAPDAEAKMPTPVKGQPMRTDGRRGDTESVPARDTGAKEEGSVAETPVRAPLARPDVASKGPAIPLQTGPIQRPPALDPALLKQTEELKEEISKLKQERELLRLENEKEARRREEVRVLEKQIEEQKKTAAESEARVSALNASLQEAQAAVSKLDVRRREVANLDSQLESTRSQLVKVEADISMAGKSLQALHAEAEKANGERTASFKKKELAAAELATLQQKITEAETRIQEQAASAAEKTVPAIGLDDPLRKNLEAMESSLLAGKEELAQVRKTVQDLRDEETRLASGITRLKTEEVTLKAVQTQAMELETRRGVVEATVSGLLVKQSAAEARFAELEKQNAEAEERLRETSARKAQAESEHEGLKKEHEQRVLQLAQVRKEEALQRESLGKVGVEAEASLRAAEERFKAKAEELKILESRTSELTLTLDDLTAAGTRLSQAQESLKAVETHKGEITAVIAQMVKDRDTQTKELLAATEKGKAQHTLALVLASKRESLEKEVREVETQKSSLEAELGKLREVLRQSETDLAARQTQMAELDKRQLEQAAKMKTAEDRAEDLQRQIVAQGALVKDLDGLEKNLATITLAFAAATQNLDTVTAETQRLKVEREDCEKRIPELRAETEKLQAELAAKLKDLAAGESKVAALAAQARDMEARSQDIASLDAQLVTVHKALTQASQEHEKVVSALGPLVREREEHEKSLPGLKTELVALKGELGVLLKDKQATAAALEKAQADRKAAQEQAEALRTESANLEKLLSDKRSLLESETKTKLAEANVAETRLRALLEKVTAGEQRTSVLAEKEVKLNLVLQALDQAEKARLAEQTSTDELARQREGLRKEMARLEDESRGLANQNTELARKLKTEEAKVADAEARLQKATAAQQAAEAHRMEAEAVAARVREEEKNLRKQIPSLQTEMASVQGTLSSLTKEREEASQFVSRLNASTDHANKKLAELQQQISQLEESYKMREERLMKAQEEVDKEGVRLKSAQEASRVAEHALQDLEKEVKEARLRTEAARTQTAGLEAELGTRLDRVEKLRMEEIRLAREAEALNLETQKNSGILAELQTKIREEEGRLSEFIHQGGQVLALGAALTSLESRQTEAGRALREASERELAVQVKINAQQELLNRESARVEQLRKERSSLETELSTFADSIEKQATLLQNQETEQRQRLAELGNEHREQAASLAQVQQELSGLSTRRAEFAQTEAQLHHWKEVEARLRGQLLELEEKHEVMRRGLSTEESTVIMFAHDIIKRIDLIDALSCRYAGHSGGDVVAQLRTLRHSFEDILFQHGISEFDISADTEVDLELRKRITVVESMPGKNKPRVVETCRSGFIYSREEGHEFVLRKVEVRTSSD